MNTDHTVQEPQQLLDDLLNAMELASYVRPRPKLRSHRGQDLSEVLSPSERAIPYGTSLLSSGIDLSFETYISLREYERSPTQLEDIYTAGSIILHEYTHTLALVVPPLMKETDDGEYIWSVDLARASI